MLKEARLTDRFPAASIFPRGRFLRVDERLSLARRIPRRLVRSVFNSAVFGTQLF